MVTFELDSSYRAWLTEMILGDIGHARYLVGEAWHQADIQWARIGEDGVLETAFLIDHSVCGDIMVTGVELVSRRGMRIGGTETSIARKDAVEGILYTVRMKLMQITPAQA